MKNNDDEFLNTYFVSPLEVRHYVLDIPVTKSKYQYNAVKFALKPLYPGNDDTAIIDYVIKNKRVIGIAGNSERIHFLKQHYKHLVSPSLVCSQIKKNGITISLGKDWIELQVIQDGFPVYLQDYSETMVNNCITDYSILLEKYKVKENKRIVYLFDSESEIAVSTFKEKGFICEYIIDYQNLYDIRYVEVFVEHKKMKNHIPIYVLSVFFLFLSLLDFNLYKKRVRIIKQLEKLKTDYQTEKQSIMESVSSFEKEEKIIDNNIALSDLFSEIYKSSYSMRILSFSLNDNMFKFEAENSTAINVLDNLSESKIFEDIVLHQSIPQENGNERFVISGKLKND